MEAPNLNIFLYLDQASGEVKSFGNFFAQIARVAPTLMDCHEAEAGGGGAVCHSRFLVLVQPTAKETKCSSEKLWHGRSFFSILLPCRFDRLYLVDM